VSKLIEMVLPCALEESTQGRLYAGIANQITIKTEIKGNKKQAIIRIKDNGVGMSEAVLETIFDYLFTTKGVGKKTGWDWRSLSLL